MNYYIRWRYSDKGEWEQYDIKGNDLNSIFLCCDVRSQWHKLVASGRYIFEVVDKFEIINNSTEDKCMDAAERARWILKEKKQ